MSPTESAAPAPQSPNDGVIDAFFSRIFGRSWKTTLTGFLALACGIAPLIPALPPVVLDVCKVALPIMTGGGLMMAKDHNVSGTQK